jgi:hypothetical protein
MYAILQEYVLIVCMLGIKHIVLYACGATFQICDTVSRLQCSLSNSVYLTIAIFDFGFSNCYTSYVPTD